jgi:hypothetical protein
MKKTILTALLVFSATLIFGQLKFGLKAGLNISNQQNAYTGATQATNPLLKDGQAILDLAGGGFMNVRLNEDLQLSTQLIASNQGYKMDEIRDLLGNTIIPKRTYKLHYLRIPVQLLYAPSYKFGSPWIGAGPYAAVLVNGSIKSPSATMKLKNIGNDDTDSFKRFDFGISPTLGLTLKNGMLFGIEYNLGLADVTPGEGKSTNTVWNFHLGFLFNASNN